LKYTDFKKILKAHFIIGIMDRKMVGILGEEISKRYLESKGHQIMETNFHSRFGEIDIISEKDSS